MGTRRCSPADPTALKSTARATEILTKRGFAIEAFDPPFPGEIGAESPALSCQEAEKQRGLLALLALPISAPIPRLAPVMNHTLLIAFLLLSCLFPT